MPHLQATVGFNQSVSPCDKIWILVHISINTTQRTDSKRVSQ